MILVSYLIKTILISVLLFCYYWFFLRNKQFHHYNRFYLLSIVLIALVLPLLNIPVPGHDSPQENNAAIRLLTVGAGVWEQPVTISPGNGFLFNLISWQSMVYIIYGLGVFVFFISLVRSILYIIMTKRRYAFEQIDGIRFFQTDEPGTPFSFLKNIFWNKRLDMQSNEGRQIFRHEVYHVHENHSFDILFLEIIKILFWFNPVLYLISKEIKAIHEFLADEYAVSDDNRYSYAELLVLQSLNNKKLQLFNPFFHNQIKRRIAMLTKFETKRNSYLSRVMILPLLLILCGAFAFKINHKGPIVTAAKPIVVVIDAGHGGIDPGTVSGSGVAEKDLTLSIAKKIQQLAGSYPVQIVMTREKDELPGNATNIKDGLQNRTDIAIRNKADIFLSIHSNADKDHPEKNGFKMYISDNNASLLNKNIQLGSALSEEIKKDYTVDDEIIKVDHGVAVLTHSSIPAIIVECGFITNDKDLAFINNEKNQEKIAKDILEGIVRYENSYGYNRPGLSTQQDPLVSSLNRYLLKHIKYPASALEKNMDGLVDAEFILDEKGGFRQINFLPSLPKDEKTIAIHAVALSKYKEPDHPVSKTEFGQPEIVPFQEEIKHAVSGYQSASAEGKSNKIYLHISFDIESNNVVAQEKNTGSR